MASEKSMYACSAHTSASAIASILQRTKALCTSRWKTASLVRTRDGRRGVALLHVLADDVRGAPAVKECAQSIDACSLFLSQPNVSTNRPRFLLRASECWHACMDVDAGICASMLTCVYAYAFV